VYAITLPIPQKFRPEVEAIRAPVHQEFQDNVAWLPYGTLIGLSWPLTQFIQGKSGRWCAASIPPKVLAVAWQWPVLTRNEPLYLQQTAALGPSLEQL